MEEKQQQRQQQQQQPSFPSNYVTLVQLQERWLKDKQRKQQQQQQQQEEVTQKTESEIVQSHGDGADRVGEGGEEAEKKKKKSKNKYKAGEGKRAEEVAAEGVVVHAPMSHGEKQGPKETRNEKSRGARAKPRAKELAGGEVVVHALLANGEEEEEGVSERRKNRKGREIRAEINVLDRTAPIEAAPRDSSKKAYVRVEKEIQAPLAIGEKEKEKVSGRRNRRRRGVRGDTRAEGSNLDQTARIEPEFGAKEVVPGKQVVVQAPLTNCEKEKSTGKSNQTADIEPKFGGLAVNGGIGGNDDGLRRTRAHHNGSHRRRSGYVKQGSREVRNSKDARMVWVKKEEVFDGNVCGAQKSGSSRAVSGLSESMLSRKGFVVKEKDREMQRHRNHGTPY